jgi:putative ABC transport system permease protein
VVSEVFSRRNGLTVGDIHEERIDNVLLRLPILGIVRDYRPRGGVVFYDLGALNAQIPSSIWTGVRFFIHDDVPNPEQAAFDLQEKIIQCTGDPLDIILGRELRRVILQIFDETFAVTGVLLLIALIVAALGITSTLTVQVLERSTQLNTIFAIGGSRLQIRAMIFWEAALMVVVGQIAGLICGFMLSYLLVFVINYQSFGWTFHYAVNWPVLFLSLPLIVMTAIFSSFPAMRVIFRMSPADILRVR